MSDVLEPGHLVLVAVAPRRQDVEIARVLGWYRIPVRHAPKVIAVDWLALFETGPARGIRVMAPVRGHELTTRGDLFRDQADHPRAGELYYKLQLGPLQALGHPVRAARNQRLTFVYTTGEQLQKARDVAELTVFGDERRWLFRNLRERGAVLSPARQAGRPAGLDEVLSCLGCPGDAA
jgi:hypothetical protein